VPSYRPGRNGSKNKPWYARAKRDGVEWALGSFATREEALAREEEFRKNYPPKQNRRGIHQC
jgi:hypothetical protein